MHTHFPKIIAGLMMTIVFGFVNASYVSAHELIPQAVVEYITEHPDATQAEIEGFIANTPALQSRSGARGEELIRSVRSTEGGFLDVFFNFVKLGIEHVLSGLDHVLFVLVIILSALNFRQILHYVTSFTIAHSTTLILAATGVVFIPSRIVEPIIAFSIVYLALVTLVWGDTAWSKKRHHGIGVIFLFGLFHGLGFAGIITDIGIPSEQLIPALLSFNVGVEVAQLLVVCATLPFIYLVRRESWYTNVLRATGLLIALIAMIWTLERIIGLSLISS